MSFQEPYFYLGGIQAKNGGDTEVSEFESQRNKFLVTLLTYLNAATPEASVTNGLLKM